MIAEMLVSISLWKSLRTAVLLTGSVKQGETAVGEGIQLWNVNATTEEQLLQKTKWRRWTRYNVTGSRP